MSKPVVIVGAGLAGLACARNLAQQGIEVLVLDAADRPGGRLKTDTIDGYRLDRGFQVYFTAYPTASKTLNLRELNLRKFEPGARIWDGKTVREFHRDHLIEMALSDMMTFGDKMRMLAWNRHVASVDYDNIWHEDDTTTLNHLRELGISDRCLRLFIRPFLSGIFLDKDLGISKRMTTFVWKMMMEGEITLPAEGIEAIPQQLVAGRSEETFRMNASVREVLVENGRATGVRLQDGEEIDAEAVVVATDPPTAQRLAGVSTPSGSKESTCVYFEAEDFPDSGAFLHLNATGRGLVNEVVPMTNIAPELSKTGKQLISATLLDTPNVDDAYLAKTVRYELQGWFKEANVAKWRPLAVYRVPYAQMPMPPYFNDRTPGNQTETEHLFVAGEFTENSSIDGAVKSGLKCADAVVRTLTPVPSA
jgi:phytoene dehydrogenase-like protein